MNGGIVGEGGVVHALRARSERLLLHDLSHCRVVHVRGLVLIGCE